MVAEALKAGALLLVAAVAQVSLFSAIEIGEAHPQLALVSLVGVALLRGPAFGAIAGFWAGLVLDIATLETLGFSSLLLTVAGYWCGRLGEVMTARSAGPLLSAVLVTTIAVGIGSALLHFLIGETLPVGRFFASVLLPAVLLNLLFAYPIYVATRRLFGPVGRRLEPSADVR